MQSSIAEIAGTVLVAAHLSGVSTVRLPAAGPEITRGECAYFAQANLAAIKMFIRTDYEHVAHLADLPKDVQSALNRRSPMAEAGAAWNSTDVLERPSRDALPRQRFIFAGKSPKSWFVYSQRGGIAVSQQVVMLRKRPLGGFEVEAEWPIRSAARSIEELKAAARLCTTVEGSPAAPAEPRRAWD